MLRIDSKFVLKVEPKDLMLTSVDKVTHHIIILKKNMQLHLHTVDFNTVAWLCKSI